MGFTLELNMVDQLRRLGEPRNNYNRNVLFCLNSGLAKQTIIGNRGKLRGTDIYINNDLDKETQLIFSKHRQIFKKLRESGANVKVRNGVIWINDIEYSPEDIEDVSLEKLLATNTSTNPDNLPPANKRKRGRPTGSTSNKIQKTANQDSGTMDVYIKRNQPKITEKGEKLLGNKLHEE